MAGVFSFNLCEYIIDMTTFEALPSFKSNLQWGVDWKCASSPPPQPLSQETAKEDGIYRPLSHTFISR